MQLGVWCDRHTGAAGSSRLAAPRPGPPLALETTGGRLAAAEQYELPEAVAGDLPPEGVATPAESVTVC
jgi:hypothetical protein